MDLEIGKEYEWKDSEGTWNRVIYQGLTTNPKVDGPPSGHLFHTFDGYIDKWTHEPWIFTYRQDIEYLTRINCFREFNAKRIQK
jgi:hypothetical protein